MEYYLAQINIAKLLAPIDSPLLQDFVDDLDRINAIADESDGFVWRLKDDSGNATQFNPFDNASIIVNLSVWKNVEVLKEYVYRSAHMEVFRKRAKWFEKMETPHMALWWTRADALPTAEEGRRRIMHLQAHGETAEAFTFKRIFDKPV